MALFHLCSVVHSWKKAEYSISNVEQNNLEPQETKQSFVLYRTALKLREDVSYNKILSLTLFPVKVSHLRIQKAILFLFQKQSNFIQNINFRKCLFGEENYPRPSVLQGGKF